MTQKFKCKESGCDKKVSYEPIAFFGLIRSDTIPIPKRKTKHVYLTCENDHTHKYTVTVEE